MAICPAAGQIAFQTIFSGKRLFRNFYDLRGHSRGNRRSDLIFFFGGGGGYHIFCVLADRHESSQGLGEYTMSTCTSITSLQ